MTQWQTVLKLSADGLTTRQIAERLGIPIGNVYAAFYRAGKPVPKMPRHSRQVGTVRIYGKKTGYKQILITRPFLVEAGIDRTDLTEARCEVLGPGRILVTAETPS